MYNHKHQQKFLCHHTIFAARGNRPRQGSGRLLKGPFQDRLYKSLLSNTNGRCHHIHRYRFLQYWLVPAAKPHGSPVQDPILIGRKRTCGISCDSRVRFGSWSMIQIPRTPRRGASDRRLNYHYYYHRCMKKSGARGMREEPIRYVSRFP